jgi:hypothetical protein
MMNSHIAIFLAGTLNAGSASVAVASDRDAIALIDISAWLKFPPGL